MIAARGAIRGAARDRIQVVVASLESVPAEATLRPVRSDGAALTAASRLLEVAAGEAVLRRLESAGELPVGGAVLTPGGGHTNPFLIHVVLQSPTEPVSEAGVRKGLTNALRRAGEWGLESLALPPLGTGAGNLDAEGAATAMAPVLFAHLERSDHPARVVVAVASTWEEEAFRSALHAEEGAGPGTDEVRASDEVPSATADGEGG